MRTHYLLSCSVVFTICCMSSVNCEQCDDDEDGDIRLSGGNKTLEGRVEICLGNEWGTVCHYGWGRNDASVVCRQLGFSSEGSQALRNSYFGEGTGQIHFYFASCSGLELRLADCVTYDPEDFSDSCFHSQDAGVRCQPSPPAPQEVTTVSTDTSVLVSWQVLDPPPDSYRITIAYTSTSNQTYTISTQVLGTATEVEYNQLIPQQQYTCCVIAVYGSQTSHSCELFQTSPSHGSNSSQLVGGVLGFVIAVLVLLLVVAGVGLAYPRCVRSRVKDKKYLSSISQFLDENVYMSRNSAYVQRPQQPSRDNAAATATGGGQIPSYETIQDSSTSHVTSEMQGPVHYEVLKANGPVIESQDYEVPQEPKGKDEANKDAYSRLHHK